MDNAEQDKRVLPGNQVMEQGKHESVMQDAFLKQDGMMQDGCRVLPSEKFHGMLTNRQSNLRSNMASMDASSQELPTSISASPVTLSGLYCSSSEASMKDIPPSFRSSSAMLSGLYSSDGAVKDYSVFAAASKVAAAASPCHLTSHVNELKIPAVNPTLNHIQRPWFPQKIQNHQIKSVDKDTSSQASIRVARPPGEGRGKNQLLPRYWPRITDQELQLLTTKDSNSTITPLFEKVLSASDAGKIGRLVLPKACAEAYFPPISQAEGLPIIVQDISGKDWTFQFRFWPNNNSRMYVLEGITPCIQSMQLQAGDTVIFSRRDPEGKLVMGYRRAPNLPSSEEAQRTMGVGSSSMAPSGQILSRHFDKSSSVATTTGVLSQSIKSSSKAQMQRNFGQIVNQQATESGFGLPKTGMNGSRKPKEGSPFNLPNSSDKRKAYKEISFKSKMPKCEPDSLEFKMNWEEAQSLLQSPPNAIPSIVTIEGYDFEEYEDPPVFGKEIISISSSPRKLSSMQPNEEKISTDLLLQNVKAAKKQVLAEPPKESEPLSGLETLAYLATAEESMNAASPSTAATINAPPLSSPAINAAASSSSQVITNTASSSSAAATTTKHPRHRPGCSCIVCIQPPSGKGPKHKPNCDCNVCMTVKRRFHTLMLRRKKLQSEREAESLSYRNQNVVKEGGEGVGGKRLSELNPHKSGSWQGQASGVAAVPRMVDTHSNGNGRPFSVSSSTGSYAMGLVKYEHDLQVGSRGPQIDLNSHPEREEETNRGSFTMSMKSLLQSASYPLDIYLRQQGLASLVCNEQLQSSGENSYGNSIVQKDNEYEEKHSIMTGSDGLQHNPSLVKNHLKQ